jgi:hypothetical protein
MFSICCATSDPSLSEHAVTKRLKETMWGLVAEQDPGFSGLPTPDENHATRSALTT